MAVFYALVIDRQIPGSTLLKGLGYALFVWLLNAFVVLPLLGEGIAGARLLTVLGMVCFALAHTAFFIILAYLYAALDGTLKFPDICTGGVETREYKWRAFPTLMAVIHDGRSSHSRRGPPQAISPT